MSALRKSEEDIVRLRSDDDIEAYRYALAGHGPQHETIVEVDPDDDLTSVRSKLEGSRLPRAVIIIPSDAKTLREGLEFRVLRRLQRELGLDVVIVSRDINRRGLARENGFHHVFHTLQGYYNSKDSGVTRTDGTTFTDPELSSAGLTEEEALKAGIKYDKAVFPVSYIPKAQAIFKTEGLIKMIAAKDTGLVLGVHILAHNSSETIQQASVYLQNRYTLDDFGKEIGVYPTMAEGLKLCAQSFTRDVNKLSCCA